MLLQRIGLGSKNIFGLVQFNFVPFQFNLQTYET